MRCMVCNLQLMLRHATQTCSMGDHIAMSGKSVWLVQEVHLPEVPPATPEDQILLVCQSPLLISAQGVGHRDNKDDGWCAHAATLEITDQGLPDIMLPHRPQSREA